MTWIAAAGWSAAAFFGLMYRAELNRCIEAENKLTRMSIQYIRNLTNREIIK